MKTIRSAIILSGLVLAGCQQGGNVQTTVQNASSDVGNFAADAGDRIENFAGNAGQVIENGASATANKAREVVNDIADGPDQSRNTSANASANASTNKTGR